MKKIVLAVFVFLFLALGQAKAAGLVPCGDDLNGNGKIDLSEQCSFCDFFKLLSNILNFAFGIVIVVATLMLVVGGVYFFFAGANPGALETGKKIITSTLIGLVIIFAAFMIVGVILNAIGLAEWTQDIYKTWWQPNGFFRITGC